jgi:orotidine-5'-phosphate decarboxylase
MRNPIIVALDVPTAREAFDLAARLGNSVGGYKVGSELFTSAGPEIVKELRRKDASVFLDLKYHDIPNTVAKAVANATRLDVQMLTIHTSGGTEMMRAAEESAQKTASALGSEPPLVLGVTVLTSMSTQDLAQIGCTGTVGNQVERLALLAAQAGLRGLVCSPLELAMLRQTLPGEMKFVTPGIRATHDPAGDQKRTLSAREAMEAGATWLVIGRPIYAAPEPRAAAEKILASLPPPPEPPKPTPHRGFGA